MSDLDTMKAQELSIEEAEGQIRFVKQRVAIMGRNDSELGDIERIIVDLKAGTISPIDAVAAAEKIEQDKQQH